MYALRLTPVAVGNRGYKNDSLYLIYGEAGNGDLYKKWNASSNSFSASANI